MKKWQILIPSVMVASTPLIILAGCNKSSGVTFKVQEKNFTASGNTGQGQLLWTPATHDITFILSGSHFTYDGGVATQVIIAPTMKKGQASVTITFESEVEADLTNGVLKFQYKDMTTGKTGTKTIRNITVSPLSL